MKTTELDLETAALIAEEELMGDVVKPSGGDDARKYEVYASRCPSKK